MRRSFAVIAAGLVCVMVAAAQSSNPRMDTFLGYMYVRANSASDIPSFSANGGGGQFAYNFNKWISAVADVGAVHTNGFGGIDLDSTFMNFLFGPRISYRNHTRLTPYGQILWGGVHVTSSTAILAVPVEDPGFIFTPNDAFVTRVGTSQTAFAMTVGGGLDVTITKHIRFRPIGLDYYLTRLENPITLQNKNQNNLRYTAGINFTFGAQ